MDCIDRQLKQLSTKNSNQTNNDAGVNSDRVKELPDLFSKYMVQESSDDISTISSHSSWCCYNDKYSTFLSLPTDILYKICRNLKFKDIINVELCNKELFRIARNENSHSQFNTKYGRYLNDFGRFNKIDKLVIDDPPDIMFETSSRLSNRQQKKLQFSFPLFLAYRFLYKSCLRFALFY